jgi:hypothetical protein
MFVTMVHDIQDYWVFGLCPLSGILKNRRTQRFGNWVSFRPQVSPALSPEHGNISSFRNVVFCFLEYRTMDKVQKPSSPELVKANI